MPPGHGLLGREDGEDPLLLTTQGDTGDKVGTWKAELYQNKARHCKKYIN